MTVSTNTWRGQGLPIFGDFNTTTGKIAHGFLVGQRAVSCVASELKITTDVKTKDIRESCTGSNGLIDQKPREGNCTIEMTLHKFSRLELAMAMYGVAADVLSGTVTGEVLATLAVGDLFHAKHPRISDLVITDSAGSPASLTKDTHYEEQSLPHGRGKILSLGAFTQPFKLAYAYENYTRIAGLSQALIRKGLIFDGINTDDNNAPARIWVPHIIWEPSSFNWLSADDEPIKLKGSALYLAELASDTSWGTHYKIDALAST